MNQSLESKGSLSEQNQRKNQLTLEDLSDHVKFVTEKLKTRFDGANGVYSSHNHTPRSRQTQMASNTQLDTHSHESSAHSHTSHSRQTRTKTNTQFDTGHRSYQEIGQLSNKHRDNLSSLELIHNVTIVDDGIVSS